MMMKKYERKIKKDTIPDSLALNVKRNSNTDHKSLAQSNLFLLIIGSSIGRGEVSVGPYRCQINYSSIGFGETFININKCLP